MKHKLLSMLALAGAMFTSTSVWALDPPVKPSATPLVYPVESDAWVTPEVGGTYYIYNVGTGQFLGAGNDWGTRCVTTAETNGIVTPNGSTITLAANVSHILPFTIEEAAAATPDGDVVLWNLKHSGTNKANTGDAYLAHEGNAAWVDASEGRRDGDLNGYWKVEAVNDAYILRCTTAKKVMDGETQAQTDEEMPRLIFSDLTFDEILGVDYSKTITTTSNTWADKAVGGANNSTWKFISADNLTAVTEILNGRTAATEAYQALLDNYEKVVEDYNVAMGIYKARVKLYETLTEAATTPGVDFSDAETVYLNNAATEAELLTANSSLAMKILLATAAEYPVEITSVLQNPDFEVATANGSLPPGWDITIKGQNLGQQNRTDTNTETGASITNFIEAWIPQPNTLGNGHIAQTVYGLPAGKYRLECDATSCQQSGQVEVIEGIELFIQAGVLIETTSVNTGEKKVTHFSVTFDNDGRNEMRFGLRANDANANWITADNFTLFYDGPLTENPNYKNLQKYLGEIQDKYNNEDIGNAYLCADTKDALDNAITAASNISKTAEDEAIDAAYMNLEKAFADAVASIKVYQSLLAYTTLNPEGSKLAFYEDATAENKWDALSQILHGLQSDFDTAYEEGTWSDAEVTEHINSIIPTILNWVQEHPEALKEGNDLTLLLINADFSEGDYFAGWDAADDEVQPGKDYGTIPGWTIASGNITQLHGSVIETYHRKFDFNQTIKNMPAGVYDISVQGFVRHDTDGDHPVNDGKGTIFYAGDLETTLMLRADQWSETNIYDPERDGNPCGGAQADAAIQNSIGETVYVPDGMSGFYFWKQAENTSGETMDYLNWQEGDLYYTNHIKATLKEAGDFVIGMKSSSTMDWIIWSNFSIKYLGNAGEIYAMMATEDFGTLTRVYESTDYLTLKAKADYAEIAKENYSAIATLEAYNAYKAKVDALNAYIQEGTKLGKALHDLLSEYGEKVNVVTFDTSDFISGKYSEYSTNLENGNCPDNDYLRVAPDVLAAEWTQCAMKQADTALFNNLGEIIINPQYTTAGGSYTLDGWNLEKEEEVTVKNVAGEGVAEVYNPSGEYKFYQTIQGLSEGYYRITVDGFFRPGDMKQSDGREACVAIPSRAYLFAESGDETWKSPLKNILVGHDALEGVGSESTWTWGDPEQGDETLEYTPNDVAAANQYFNNVHNDYAEATNLSGENEMQSVYRNVVNAYVGEDGILTIGISNHGFEPATNDWACFSNWTLSYMGTEAPDAVKGISVKGATAPAAIFTIDGRQASRLQRGMNIVRQANGDVKKVLVK